MLRGWRQQLEASVQRLWFEPTAASGLTFRLLYPLLWAASWLVAQVARRRLVQRRSVPASPVPVVVVGNMVVGGSGKTPITIALLRHWKTHGMQVGALARGYRTGHQEARMVPLGPWDASSAAAYGDEPLVIRQATQAPVAVGPQRAAALALLLDRHPAIHRVASDDGLQHVQLPRYLELCVWDERGVGNGQCLPLGPLREPVAHARQVDAWLIRSACDDVNQPWPSQLAQVQAQALKDQIGGPTPPWFEVRMRQGPLRPLRQGDVWAHCRTVMVVTGIAAPQRLMHALQASGVLEQRKASLHPLPDHAPASAFQHWVDALNPSHDTALVITAKDAVKLTAALVRTHAWWVWDLEAVIDPEGLRWIEAKLNQRPGTHVRR